MGTRCVRSSGCWIGALSLLISGLAFGQCPWPINKRTTTVAPADRAFAREAAAAGSLEMKMSAIAALRANSDTVRQFATSRVEDQSKTRRKLKEIAISRNLEICDTLDVKSSRRFLALLRYTGDEFDREYLTLQVDQHRRTLELFQQQVHASASDEWRGFAQATLPMLEAQLKLAQSLADSR